MYSVHKYLLKPLLRYRSLRSLLERAPRATNGDTRKHVLKQAEGR